MMSTPVVSLQVDLSNEQARALATFLKRSMFADFRGRAESDDEAMTMLEAGVEVFRSLKAQGVNPRRSRHA